MQQGVAMHIEVSPCNICRIPDASNGLDYKSGHGLQGQLIRSQDLQGMPPLM